MLVSLTNESFIVDLSYADDLQDCTIRSCDFDAEQTCVLHSPEKKTEPISSDSEVHMALTPLQPVVFFGFHKRMSVTGLFVSKPLK